MSKKILILSDIHGNAEALNSILNVIKVEELKGIVLLGDLIDYGPESNEVINRLERLPKNKIIVNIWGNHEKAIMEEEYGDFSTLRGVQSAQYTRSILSKESKVYLATMEQEGKQEFMLYNKKCLAIHASQEDKFWKSICPGECGNEYAEYDFVFSGHSHVPHFFSVSYPDNKVEYRNRKKTIFINPGSVGQPRNHNPNAQGAILNLENLNLEFLSIEYDIKYVISKFTDEIDPFYKERLKRGV